MRNSKISEMLKNDESTIFRTWIKEQTTAINFRSDLIEEHELQQQSREFLQLFIELISNENLDDFSNNDTYITIKQFLNELSVSRATKGFSAVETSLFIFSLKLPILNLLKDTYSEKANSDFFISYNKINSILDQLGLYTFERFQKSREEIISRQQQEMLELSTPVVKLWEGILVLPLIGTLDSNRTQQIMENLLQKIVDTNSSIAIIDITGIPMVDTLVAQHLIKTISAARLMGAECIVSGIRPQIAQTIVHLGISLENVITRSTLADAVKVSLHKAGYSITHK